MLLFEIEQLLYFRKDGAMHKVDPASQQQEKPPKDTKLSAEIRLVRTLICQTESRASECGSLEELLNVLDSVAKASAHLGGLLKTEKALEDGESMSDYVKAALDEIREEMKRQGIDSILTSGLG